ncbi:MAG: hypothetical protein EBX52_10560, partial [Proteobacteria bacterium]|nr:hypothetical protein [Pseudomonadota bacterium]
PHKLIQTSWLSAGAQYFFNDDWGLSIVVPSAYRLLRQESEHGDHGGGNLHEQEKGGDVGTTRWWGMGDVRINAYYTGLSRDMSTGFNLGVKVPSGNWSQPGVDRDNQIGTGYSASWGDAPGGWFPFTGSISNVAIYSQAMDEASLVDHFQAAGR